MHRIIPAFLLALVTLEVCVCGEEVEWAFRPVARPAVPMPRDAAWSQTPVDAFIGWTLEQHDLAPAPPASRRIQVRRLYFDLVGLPPAPAEIDRFLADRRPDAWQRLVDRLLASPAYGERWAQHWLDVVRFADSDGFEYDDPRPHAWRYRDWAIDSLNQDKPFG